MLARCKWGSCLNLLPRVSHLTDADEIYHQDVTVPVNSIHDSKSVFFVFCCFSYFQPICIIGLFTFIILDYECEEAILSVIMPKCWIISWPEKDTFIINAALDGKVLLAFRVCVRRKSLESFFKRKNPSWKTASQKLWFEVMKQLQRQTLLFSPWLKCMSCFFRWSSFNVA